MGEFIRPAQGDDLVAAITELGFQKMPIPGADAAVDVGSSEDARLG
jgi:hypothetical protein